MFRKEVTPTHCPALELVSRRAANTQSALHSTACQSILRAAIHDKWAFADRRGRLVGGSDGKNRNTALYASLALFAPLALVAFVPTFSLRILEELSRLLGIP